MEFTIIVQAIGCLCIAALLYSLNGAQASKEESTFFDSQPAIVGLREEWFAWMRATFRSLFDTQRWVFDGYSKYSKSNIPFVVPSIDRGPIVLIPPRQIKRVYGLPEHILDVYLTQNETIQTKWTVWDEEVWVNNFQIKVIRHQMTRNMEHLTPLIAKELSIGFERWWGTSTTEWKEIRVWDSCLKLIAGAGNGAFCGAPLCRDDRFLTRLRDHAMSIIFGALIINCSPKILKPISGTLVGWTCDYFFRRTLKICLPYVRERLDHTAQLNGNVGYDWTPPKDALQWIIDECYATKDPAQLNPKRVAHRLLLLNDISLHSTSFTIQNVLLDLFSQDPSSGVVEALREQCTHVLKQAGGSWTRDAISKLTLVDSTIRESMRLSPFGMIGLPRTVKHPDGILLDNWSKPVPRGTVLSVPMEPIHYDEATYPDARCFNAFRFAQPDALQNIMDSFTPDVHSETPVTKTRKDESKSTATLDDAFLGFGFGKHACPGRFFALNEMKIFLAHTLLNYEVEHLKVRPEHKNIISLKMPSDKGRIRVRRLQATSEG